jgi:hypothetical protein
MSEMVERVARRLAEHRIGGEFSDLEWETMMRHVREMAAKNPAYLAAQSLFTDALRDARIAIEEMRVPTAAMIDAGRDADWVGYAESREGRSIVPTERPDWLEDDEEDPVDRRGIWRAMIEAALEPEKEKP